MSIFDWPAAIVPYRPTVMPPQDTWSANASIDGSEQIVKVRRAPFRMRLEFTNLMGPKILAWRALMAHLHGRANMVRVPMWDEQNSVSVITQLQTPVLHSDGTPFSDMTGYIASDLSGVFVTVASGASMLTVDFGNYGPLLQAGQYFGLGEDPHIATQVFYEGSVATVHFSSEAKRSHVDTAFRLCPTMIMRKAEDEGGELALEGGAFGSPSLDLIEVIRGPFS